MPIINATALIEARKRKGWTQVELSEATTPQINVSTISRLERGTSPHIRKATLQGLSRALGVQQKELCSPMESDRDVLKLSLDAAARNALALVALRYRIHRERIVELAPLLFFIVAEQCLRDRQRRLDELYEAADAIANFRSQIQHLPRQCLLEDEAMSSEESSIKKRDLFATSVFDDANKFRWEFNNDYNEEAQNPFVSYLRNALNSIGAPKEEIDAVTWHPNGWPHYKICADQARNFVGNDTEAVDAVLSGTAALHEMPKGSHEERAAWARAEQRRKLKDLYDVLEELSGQI